MRWRYWYPSRGTRRRPARNIVGGVLSTAGLTAFVYGVIEQPRRGWGDPVVLGTILAGLALVGAFAAWERRTGHPMIDLGLFGRPRFLWGTLAATISSFALFGLLFAVPQYLQAVRGADALATGVRLLPMMAGLIVGARTGELVSRRTGAKLPVAGGLLVIGAGLALGATTSVHSGYPFAAAWLAVVGAGTGLSLAPAMDAVLGELPPERSGAGSALTQTFRQVGGALGVALLGSVLSAAYTRHLDVTGLPAPAAHAARDTVAGAVAVAARLHDTALAASAQSAYTRAMDQLLVVCAAAALLGALLAALFLPARGVEPVTAAPAGRPAPDSATIGV